MATITIIGAGMMGSALAFPARENGNTVRLVGTHLDNEIIDSCRGINRHPKLEKDFPIGVDFYYIDRLDGLLEDTDFIICGVSSFGVDWFKDKILPKVGGIPVLSVTKGMFGLNDGSLMTYPEYFLKEYNSLNINAVGGGCTSYELVAHDPTIVTYCGGDIKTLKEIKSAMQTDYYNITLSTDMRGVECAVALKNAYALGVTLAVGANERINGLGEKQHYNSQAALFMQSTKEMRNLVKYFGGKADSFDTGIGDLFVTVFGGRTRLLGTLLGRGLSIDDAMKELDGVTLESKVITERLYTALNIQFKKGVLKREDFPLLCHLGGLMFENGRGEIPWKSFEREEY